MCGIMVNIQSPTAEIRSRIKKRRKKPQGKNIMSASATQGGLNKGKRKTKRVDCTSVGPAYIIGDGKIAITVDSGSKTFSSINAWC